MITENSNRAHGHGNLNLATFEPFPKNPAISKIFREIGLADELGSGMRNTYKYTKLYSDMEPEFREGDIFRTIIPLKESATATVGVDYLRGLLISILPGNRIQAIILHEEIQIIPALYEHHILKFSGSNILQPGNLLSGTDTAPEYGTLIFPVKGRHFRFPGFSAKHGFPLIFLSIRCFAS